MNTEIVKFLEDILRFIDKEYFSKGSLDAHQSSRAIKEFNNRRQKILFVAPERLSNERFIQTLHQQTIDLLVIDELGYLTLKPEQINAFFKLIGERYSKKLTIITPKTTILHRVCRPQLLVCGPFGP